MRQEMIAVAAYYRAEHRGFRGGDPVADWLEAEAEMKQASLAEPCPVVSAKQFFQEKFEAQLDAWDHQLEELKTRTKELTARKRAEIENQVQVISAKRAEAEEMLRELRKRSEDAWEDLRDGMAKAHDEIRLTIDRIVARFK